MRRHKLLCLEKKGLVLEYGAGGYSGSALAGAGLNEVPSSGDALEDEKMRIYMIRKSREEALSRERRMRRLRKLARMDFTMVGGVAPIGFYGGAGGGTSGGRPGSMSARS
jgi:hypothetical protein